MCTLCVGGICISEGTERICFCVSPSIMPSLPIMLDFFICAETIQVREKNWDVVSLCNWDPPASPALARVPPNPVASPWAPSAPFDVRPPTASATQMDNQATWTDEHLFAHWYLGLTTRQSGFTCVPQLALLIQKMSMLEEGGGDWKGARGWQD